MSEHIKRFLNIKAKTWLKDTHGLFDYEIMNESKVNNLIVSGSGYLIRENDEVKNKDLSEMKLNKYNIKIRELCKYSFDEKEKSYYIENHIDRNLNCTEENITKLENKLWFVTQAVDKKNLNEHINYKNCYECSIGDIIKLGRVKYIITEIRINGITKSIKDSDDYIFNIIPTIKEYDDDKNLTCKICLSGENENENDIFVNLCNCCGSMEKIHLSCLKSWIKTKRESYQKKLGTSYIFKKFNCEICNKPYPLNFKYKNRIYSLLDLKIPSNYSNYIILESLNQIKEKNNMKSIQLIQLKENSYVTIGRSNDSDIRVIDISVSRTHAVICYHDGKIYLFDSKSKFGTLVLMKDKVFVKNNLSSLNLQIGRTFVEISEVNKNKNKDNNNIIIANSNTQSSVSDDESDKKKTFTNPLFIVKKCEKNEKSKKNKNNS
jgi:hypothetical protein